MPGSSGSALGSAYGVAADPGFPPPVVAGVTQFRQAAPAQPASPNTDVPPAVIWGVTKFAETAVPSSHVSGPRDPPPVVWVRFGVTKEAAERELAEDSRRKIAGQAEPVQR